MKLRSIVIANILFLLALPAFGAVSLDLKSLPQPSAYQSFTSAEQVLGLEKGYIYVTGNGNEILHLGINLGMRVNDNLKPFGTPMGGPMLHLPGSVLDWMFGTKWGDKWLPALKAGVFAGYDILHPNDLKLKPSFAGIGIRYPVF